MCDPAEAVLLAMSSVTRTNGWTDGRLCAPPQAVQRADDIYGEKVHDICCENCWELIPQPEPVEPTPFRAGTAGTDTHTYGTPYGIRYGIPDGLFLIVNHMA